MQWREISTLDEWQSLLERSADRPVVVLKHSTTCPVSANALREYDDYLQGEPSAEPEYALVKVIESRPVSNKIAEDLNVKHESPQVIYFKNREKVWSATHWAVTAEHIKAVLD